MAASLKERQKAVDVLRAGGTQEQAADAAGVGLSTLKRWLKQPAFRAMISTSPNIRIGAPPRFEGEKRESASDTRSRMWVTEGEGICEVLGTYIPPSAYEAVDAVLH